MPSACMSDNMLQTTDDADASMRGGGAPTTESGHPQSERAETPHRAEKDGPPCERCDGDHRSADCPHYKHARPSHRDAWLHFGNRKSERGKDSTGRSPRGEVLRESEGWSVARQPGDGSCLFHSLCFAESRARNAHPNDAHSLRAEIAAWLLRHETDELASGDTVREVVKWESGLGVADYVRRIRGHAWGGAVEVAAFAKMRSIEVRVFESGNDPNDMRVRIFRSIGRFRAPSGSPVIRILYSGRSHYDALVKRSADPLRRNQVTVPAARRSTTLVQRPPRHALGFARVGTILPPVRHSSGQSVLAPDKRGTHGSGGRKPAASGVSPQAMTFVAPPRSWYS